jgi:hypothetical protein
VSGTTFMNNNDITPIVIDLTKKDNLNESWLRLFGFGVKAILSHMFGQTTVPVTVRGSQADIRSFANTLGREKRYLENYQKYGLDNPRTYKSKSVLDSAVSKFEKATGLKWPLK